MRAEDYFEDPPRDALERVLQEESAALAELVSNEATRAVAVLAVVIGEDGLPRCCALLSSMAEDEREKVAGALITALETEFGGRSNGITRP